jgi:hypothetical protein
MLALTPPAAAASATAPSRGLVAVSCTSAAACTAVGDSTTSSGSGTLAERWNGTAWAIQPTPNPSGVKNSFLQGVSCTSASACTAVGFYITKTRIDLTLAERWNGTAWAIQPTPNPSGVENSFLQGVSCTSASACTAVGFYITKTRIDLTLAERWNGTAWATQHTPNPSGAENSFLDGVSCISAKSCTAVGLYTTSTGIQVTLAERWNGTAWAIQHTPNPSGAGGSNLSAVSCTSTSACTAAGSYLDTGTEIAVTLAERWNGTAWAIQPTPNPSSASDIRLYAVSCTSASACTATGSFYDASTQIVVTLAERWNGTAWAIRPSPNPSGVGNSFLYAVSCTSASACTAAGVHDTGSNVDRTLAERWNGTAWVIQPTPNAGAQSTDLAGVSCTSARACTAVGYSFTSTGIQVTLAERWNGTAWAIQHTPS